VNEEAMDHWGAVGPNIKYIKYIILENYNRKVQSIKFIDHTEGI